MTTDIIRSDLEAISTITLTFLAWRSIQYILVFFTPANQFDTSTELTIEYILSSAPNSDSIVKSWNTFWNRRLWNKLLSWDAVFFIKGMTVDDHVPRYEHEYAFSPVWVKLVRYYSRGSTNLFTVLKTGVLLENLLFYFSAILLYFLTIGIFSRNNPRSEYARNVARGAVKIFIFSSVSGFVTGIYSEPLSFALTFFGMLLREKSIEILIPFNINCVWSRWPLYLLSSICFSFAAVNRSNCILLGIYYIFDLLQLIKFKRNLKALCFPLLSGGLMFTVCCYYLYFMPFTEYCPERGEWCDTQVLSTLPFTKVTFYSFIQSHYWNIGFLKYWTLNNTPNFLIALPNIVILLYSTFYFSKIYPTFTLRPLIWITRALVLLLLLFAHVQIINRVASFIPLHLWYIADRSMKSRMKKNDDALLGDDMIVKVYLYWLICWVPLQTVLFACFLPPA